MNNMTIALQITALGMGLVFAAIVLLWWLMNLLTAITADKDRPSLAGDNASESIAVLSDLDGELKARAAAVAVAMALAEQRLSSAHPLPEPPTAIVSAWQLGMRTRQLSQKGTPVSRKPRKIG